MVLANRVDAKRFNSPNDVVVKSDGSISFSDPTYGIHSDYEGDTATSEIGSSNVYRIDPRTKHITCVITDRVRPNGLACSPDETKLYVSDTSASHPSVDPKSITVCTVSADGCSVSHAQTFTLSDAGIFDGFRCDTHGNVWTSAAKGVRCSHSSGAHIGTIQVPKLDSNVCFGGPKRNRLFITAQTSLYALPLRSRLALSAKSQCFGRYRSQHCRLVPTNSRRIRGRLAGCR